MGRPPKYIIKIGDQYDDYKCISIQKDEKNYTKYLMKCTKCGKEKLMLGSTVGLRKGTKHKSCGKGLGITHDKVFYERWQSMRARTQKNALQHEYYYDRGINSDAFESFIDFYNALYPSYLEHVKQFGEHDTSLERIDVNKSYTPENCTWICLDEQRGNIQKTIYFTVTDVLTGEIEYCKNANRYALLNNLPEKYIGEVINNNRTYRGKIYKRITKEEYRSYYKEQYEKYGKKCNDYRKP